MDFSRRSVQFCSPNEAGAGETGISSPIRTNEAMNAPPRAKHQTIKRPSFNTIAVLPATSRDTQHHSHDRRNTSTTKLSPSSDPWSTAKMPFRQPHVAKSKRLGAPQERVERARGGRQAKAGLRAVTPRAFPGA